MKKDSKRCCDTTMPESIHTEDESNRGSAFAFIFGVNWPVQWMWRNDKFHGIQGKRKYGLLPLRSYCSATAAHQQPIIINNKPLPRKWKQFAAFQTTLCLFKGRALREALCKEGLIIRGILPRQGPLAPRPFPPLALPSSLPPLPSPGRHNALQIIRKLHGALSAFAQ